MFCNFYLKKTHKIVNYSTATDAGEAIGICLEIFVFQDIFDAGSSNQILLLSI